MQHNILRTDVSTIKNHIRSLLVAGRFEYSSFDELDIFPDQQKPTSIIDTRLPIDWAVYPTTCGKGESLIHVDLVQGASTRYPVFSIRMETDNTKLLFSLIRIIHDYLLDRSSSNHFIVQRHH